MRDRVPPGRSTAIAIGSAVIAAALVAGFASAADDAPDPAVVAVQPARLPPAPGVQAPAQPPMVAAAPADLAPAPADAMQAARIAAGDPALRRLLHGATYAIDGREVWSDATYTRRGVWLHVRLDGPRDLVGSFPQMRYNRAQTAYRELLAPGVVRGATSLQLLVDLVHGDVAAVIPDAYDSSADGAGAPIAEGGLR